jgi:hypothetical protein
MASFSGRVVGVLVVVDFAPPLLLIGFDWRKRRLCWLSR